jgi:uncharacterized membrane protein
MRHRMRIIPLPRCRIIRHNSRQGYMTGEGKAYLGTILGSVVLILVGIAFISEGPKHIPAFAAYAAGAVLILLAILLIISSVSKRFGG